MTCVPTPPDYRLVTRWSLPATPERVWQVLADPELTWPRWWPGLTSPWSAEDRALFVLRPVRCGYALRFGLVVTERVPPRRARLAVSGDLVGTGQVTIDPAPGGSTLELDWRVRTTRPWMRRTGRLLAPVFRRAHAHAMRSGRTGLRGYLEGVGAP